jgi:hypothetical protein
MRRLSLALIGALLAAATAQAVTLTFKDTPGAVRRYASTMTLTGSSQTVMGALPIDAKATMNLAEQVLGVKDGAATINYKLADGSMTVTVAGLPGADGPEVVTQAIPATATTFTRTPQGRVTAMAAQGFGPQVLGGGLDGVTNRLQHAGQGLEFPTGDVKVGDTWTGTVSTDLNGATAQATTTSKLTGTETVNGKTYQKIVTDITMRVPKLTMPTTVGINVTLDITLTGKATELFDAQAGELYRTDITGRVVMVMTPEGANDVGVSTTTLDLVGQTVRK